VKYFFVAAALFSFALSAKARVFDFQRENVATYFKGNYGMGNVGKTAFADSIGSTKITDSVKYLWGGELGLLVTMDSVGLRIGINLVNPQKLDGVEGKDAGGTKVYALKSTIIAVLPSAHIEVYLDKGKESRWVVAAGGGAGTVTLINDYDMVPGGPIGDFVEEGSGYVYFGDVNLGYEFVLSDNVTTFLDCGYRYIYVPKLEHKRNATTFLGTVSKGDTVKVSDGTDRKLDLSSYYIGVGFRFYINL
jgi:hypothetical protein